MPQDFKPLVDELIAQQQLIFDMLGDERIPTPRSPISEQQLEALRQWWGQSGGELPPSYVRFLKVCDGIENFCASYELFGSSDLLSPCYAPTAHALMRQGVGLPQEPPGPCIFLGWSDETTSRIIADLRVESVIPGEPVVFDGDPGNLSQHESFEAFLRMRVKANELTIKELERVRNWDEE